MRDYTVEILLLLVNRLNDCYNETLLFYSILFFSLLFSFIFSSELIIGL